MHHCNSSKTHLKLQLLEVNSSRTHLNLRLLEARLSTLLRFLTPLELLRAATFPIPPFDSRNSFSNCTYSTIGKLKRYLGNTPFNFRSSVVLLGILRFIN